MPTKSNKSVSNCRNTDKSVYTFVNEAVKQRKMKSRQNSQSCATIRNCKTCPEYDTIR